MKRFHLALSVNDISASVADYTNRLGQEPDIIVENEYALWRTEFLNFSIRMDSTSLGRLRHLGWEDDSAVIFSKEEDVNGIIWEHFSDKLQLQEIENLWKK